MTTAIAAFVQFYTDETIHGSWQNFFVRKTVSGHTYVSFDPSEILLNRSADEGGVSLTLAATNNHLSFLETAISNEYLARITFYEMPVSTEMPTDLSNAVVVSRFVGEVMGMSTDLISINVEVGAAVDAISGEIPGRKITTSLVGRLPSL